MKNTIQMIHQLADQVFVSGEDLAKQFGVSRATIASWMQDLQSYGLEINKVRGRGYRLAHRVDLLDKNRILSAINPQFRSKLGVVDVTLETDSTNETALSAHYSNTLWHLYSTEFQKTGRGRRGRQWISPLGASLMFTLSSKRQWSLDVLYLASLLVGLSAAQHLKQHLRKSVQLKWPNDLYLDGLKLGGILCELRGSPQDDALLAIGVGLNVYQAPKDTDRQATCLLNAGPAPIDRSALLAGLSESIIRDLDFAIQHGATELLSVWDDFDFLKNRDINVLQGDQTISGRAMGIDEKGQLRLLCPNGKLEVFNGGEVSVRW